MIKYTVNNNFRFLEFTNLSTGNILSINKECVKEIVTESSDPYLFIVQLDDIGNHSFNYTEVTNPTTGLAFTSLDALRSFTLESLNDLSVIETVPLGTWNADTNIPVLADGGLYDDNDNGTADAQSTANQYYLVGVGGTTTIDGNSTWVAGDYIKSNGAVWIRIESSDTIHANKVLYEATDVDAALDDIYTKLNISELDDVDTTGLVDGDILVWDIASGDWLPGIPASGGRSMYTIQSFVSGSQAIAPTVDGLYILESTRVEAWIPAAAVVGDILKLDSAVWTIDIEMVSEPAGAIEIETENPTNYKVNYVWNGSEWSSYNAFITSDSLDAITQTVTIGNLSNYTGAELKGKSLSWMWENALFTTVYTAPSLPTLALDSTYGNYERGIDIDRVISIAFDQNGGGDVNASQIIGYESGSIVATLNGVAVPASVDLDNINGYNLLMPGITEEIARIRVSISYDEGPIPTDNQGVEYPGDTISSGTIEADANYISRYPLWYGVTSERFSVDTGEESTLTPFTAPNDGTGSGLITFNEAWIRANLTQTIFTSNLNSQTDSLQIGSVHAFVVCPPGISVTTAQIYAAGSWLDWDDFEDNSFTVSINDAADANPKTYTVYFARSIAADNFSAVQNFRFTTSGSVTP